MQMDRSDFEAAISEALDNMPAAFAEDRGLLYFGPDFDVATLAGTLPENLWLTGDSFGWRGPWGTTYGANLRLFMGALSEDQWVEVAKTLENRPPMPWFNLNAMAEADLRAIYRFTRSLGDPGNPAPDYVPPDEEPEPPYALFPSPPKSD